MTESVRGHLALVAPHRPRTDFLDPSPAVLQAGRSDHLPVVATFVLGD
jgi:hypothetical protein